MTDKKLENVKFITFNSPKGTGKSVLAQALVGVSPETRNGGLFYTTSFKDPLVRLVPKLFNISQSDFDSLYSDRETKEEPSRLLDLKGNKLSPREALIFISEEVIKPNFGKDYFGKVVANDIETVCKNHAWHNGTHYFVDDSCGFVEELQPIADLIGKENMLIVKPQVEGAEWGTDSRGDIPDELGYPTLYIENEWTQWLSYDQGEIIEKIIKASSGVVEKTLKEKVFELYYGEGGVQEFNNIASSAVPKKTLEQQEELVEEELQETYTSWFALDRVGLLDGLCDVFVTLTHKLEMEGKLREVNFTLSEDSHNNLWCGLSEEALIHADSELLKGCLAAIQKLTPNWYEAIQEVNRSNMSKFTEGVWQPLLGRYKDHAHKLSEDKDVEVRFMVAVGVRGAPSLIFFDENNKIHKGTDYSKPELEQFL